MFLTTPTLDELKQLELQELIDMLAKHTVEYVQLFKEQGVTSQTTSLREMLANIQIAIDYRKLPSAASTSSESSASTSLTPPL